MSDFAPLGLSLRVALCASLIDFVFGIALARLLIGRRHPLARLAEAFLLLPLVLPPTVVGYLLLWLFGSGGPLGDLLTALGLRVVFTPAAAVIASATAALPLMYQSARAGLEGVESRLLRAAATLGAGWFRIFLFIELPLALPGLVAGLILAFARAYGEFGATLMLAGNIPGLTETLPLAMYAAVAAGDSRRAGLLLGLSVGMAFLLVLALGFLTPRKGGR